MDSLYKSYNRDVFNTYIIHLPLHRKSLEMAERCLQTCNSIGQKAELFEGFDGTDGDKENIKIPDDQRVKLVELIRSTFPDIRKIINYLQKYSINGVLSIDNFSLVNTFITEVWNGIKDLDLMSLRKYIISNESSFQADYHMLLKAILNKLYDCDINVGNKREGILIISEYMYRHSFVIDTEINAYAALISLQNCLYS